MTLEEMIKHCEEKADCTECGKKHEQLAEWLKKLQEYKALEEQGLLAKLPCAVGDTVWDNDFGRPIPYKVTGFSYGCLNEDAEEDYEEDYEEEEKPVDEISIYYKNSNGSVTGNFAVSEIGKTVFLTKAEAEQKLEEMEN